MAYKMPAAPPIRLSAKHRQVLSLGPTIGYMARMFAKRAGRFIDQRDMEQDAFLAVIVAQSRYDGREHFSTFNYRRIPGAMIDGLRRRENRRGGRLRVKWESLPDNAENAYAAIEVPIERRVLYRELREAMNRLPRELQKLVRLKYIEEWPVEDIAAAFDRSEAWVYGRLRDAREILRLDLT